jgi:arginyl-tRNA synthetase
MMRLSGIAAGARGLPLKPLVDAERLVGQEVVRIASALFDNEAVLGLSDSVVKSIGQPRVEERGDLAIPCFEISKLLKKNPVEVAKSLGSKLEEILSSQDEAAALVSSCQVEGPYLNFKYSTAFLSQVVPAIVSRNYVDKYKSLDFEGKEEHKERVMIEYSQPNTHKAFHVGHMRNAALGDCLVRLFDFCGHDVVAANYFGDEGAHVAKCLWHLRKFMADNKLTLADLPPVKTQPRGEFLGVLYAKAVELLSLDTLTRYPFPGVYTAKVLEISKHPDASAPAGWNVVKVKISESEVVDVVCGGIGYKAGDVVAYVPVGGVLQKKSVEVKDMQGVMSRGVIVAYDELELTPPTTAADADAKDDEGEKKGKKSKKGAKKTESLSKVIYTLPADSPIGIELPELGRKADAEMLDPSSTVMDEFNKRKAEVSQVLALLEAHDSEMTALWDETKQWSLSEFKEVYQWLDCRFDHDFFESQVGDASKKLALDFFEKGVLVKSEGAIGADLTPYGYSFLILIKSDGAGLYATKDLALAQRKFEEFNIEKSIYVVDSAQSLHFQQVFKTLELMGFENAKKCFHLAYGQVRLPNGKMSTRTGTVIYFSLLKSTLSEQLMTEFLSSHVGKWSDEEIQSACQALCVATIKYGMLNVDPIKDIAFEMSKWTARSGETGIYLMYTYTRAKSILRNCPYPDDGKFVPSLIGETLRERLILLKMMRFWDVIMQATYQYRPNALTSYSYDLAKLFSMWYEQTHVAKSETPDLMFTRLKLVEAVAATLKQCLHLIGVKAIERM